MKPEEFVKKVKQSVIDDNLTIYKDLFKNTDADHVSDLYWKESLTFFKKLSDEEKETMFKIMRQVSVDTVSNIFGILDGISYLEGQSGDFLLTVDNKQEQLNGDLQDIFLEIEEEL
ncbi:transposase [Photobacterium kishitanii]|uniref:transposase n=1 Tax=Photobacterium kishitanii TaxID=318456 RepID=UPI000D177AE1|nr:transposase [Photobacterium kishitanii]PSU16341.1 transposase [Photobacterium kishitanii]